MSINVTKVILLIITVININYIHAIYQPLVIDEYEHYNRSAYNLNNSFDNVILKPTAIGYTKYIPSFIQKGISNFFNNLSGFTSLFNDIFQLDIKKSISDLMRVSINSTIGLIGLIDISSNLNLSSENNTFGNTLKHYGWKSSKYFVIPFLGPSTVRDAVGMIPDSVLNLTWWLIPYNFLYVSFGLFGLNVVNKRSEYLKYDDVLVASLDPYITIRNTYLGSIGEKIQMKKKVEDDFSIDNILNDNKH